MEIEVKYRIDKESKINRIFADEYVRSISDDDSEENLPMEAVYFDTADRRFSREGIVFRIRREGDRMIATLKWNGKNDEGMYAREEINIPFSEKTIPDRADIRIFSQSEMYETLEKLSKGKKIIPVMKMDFVRRQMRLDTGRSISMLSCDTGNITFDGKTGKICEMELELFSGSREDMTDVAEIIAGRFELERGTKSKFRQGLDLAGIKTVLL